MKFKATIEMYYEFPDSKIKEYYGTTDPQKAAEVDKSNFDNDLGNLLEVLQSNEYTVKVEPVE